MRVKGFPGVSVVKDSLAMQEMRVRFLRQEGKATHLSILGWEIPWTKKLGGLESVGSQESWIQLSN